MPTLRVVLRKGRLALEFPVELSDEAGEAERPAGGRLALGGEPWVPCWTRFDLPVDGRTVLAEFNAGRGIAVRGVDPPDYVGGV